MRQLIFSFIIFSFGVTLISCDEQGKLGLDESTKAFNLRLAPDKASFDISQGDPAINFTMYSDTKTIDKITLFVELLQFGSGGPTSRSLLKEVPGNVFGSAPSSSVSITLSEFAAAVGLTPADLAGGDIFTIYSQVNLSDGRVYPDSLAFDDEKFVNVENSFFTAAGTTSFTATLAFPVLCPFVLDEATGIYSVTRDDLEVLFDPAHKPEVVAGPGPNQVTIKDMLGHPPGYDIIVDVDPNTDVATVEKQYGWDSANFGLPFGEISVEGDGFYFSCTGFLTLDLDHTLDDGRGFGEFRIELTKD